MTCIYLPRPSLTDWLTCHAGGCYRQRNVHHSVSRLFHTCYVLSVNLLSSVKGTGCQWQTCQFWCSLVNANRAAHPPVPPCTKEQIPGLLLPTILLLGVVLLLLFSVAPFVTFMCTNSGETDSQSLVLPKWTDWYPWSLTDLVTKCYLKFFITVVFNPPNPTSSSTCRPFRVCYAELASCSLGLMRSEPNINSA